MMEITFGQPANITPAGMDQLALSFPFTVREIGEGALRDQFTEHRITAKISGTMLSIWGYERRYYDEVGIVPL